MPANNPSYTPGQVVKTARPGKPVWVGVFLSAKQAIEGCAWVGFHAEISKRNKAPDYDKALRGGKDVERKMIPLSQLQAV